VREPHFEKLRGLRAGLKRLTAGQTVFDSHDTLHNARDGCRLADALRILRLGEILR
jgi:hypothetical protein